MFAVVVSEEGRERSRCTTALEARTGQSSHYGPFDVKEREKHTHELTNKQMHADPLAYARNTLGSKQKWMLWAACGEGNHVAGKPV